MLRFIMLALLAFSYNGAALAQTCVSVPEQQAFNLIALKTSLMVGALSCNQSKQYNDFVMKFQPYILAQQHVMDSYFTRVGGLAGQSREDQYVTSLANGQSQSSLTLGGRLCSAVSITFTKVLTFTRPAELDQFAEANPPAQPIALTVCAPTSTVQHQHQHQHPQPPAATIALIASHALVVNQPPHVTARRISSSGHPMRLAMHARHQQIRQAAVPAAKKPPVPAYMVSQSI